MSQVPEHPQANGTIYCVHPHHRTNHPGKSQWTIPTGDEIASYVNAYTSQWMIGDKGWGLHIQNGTASHLGISFDNSRLLAFACYVGQDDRWHGYPGDHEANTRDIPAEPVLNAWLTNNALTPQKIRKILKGKPCSL